MAFSGELRLELRDNCLNIISQPGSKLVTELASTIIRESPRNEAIGHLALVFLLVEKGIVTEKEITQARLHATRLVDRELKTRGVALRKHYERRLAELRSKSKIGDGNLHFAIKSHQKADATTARRAVFMESTCASVRADGERESKLLASRHPEVSDTLMTN